MVLFGCVIELALGLRFSPIFVSLLVFPNHNNQTVSSQAKYRLMTSSALVDKTQLTILHFIPFLLTNLMHKVCVGAYNTFIHQDRI